MTSALYELFTHPSGLILSSDTNRTQTSLWLRMSSRQTATAQQKEHCQGLPRGRGLLAWAVKDQADKLFQVSSRSSPRLVSGTLKDAQSALSLRCPSTQSPATPARALSAPKPQAKHQSPQSQATFFLSLNLFICHFHILLVNQLPTQPSKSF